MQNVSRQSYIIYDLPKVMATPNENWEEKTLGSLADVIGGGTPDTGVNEYWNPPSIPWVTPTDISATEGIYLESTERSISSKGLKSCSAALLPVGTTLLTSRATVGECRMSAFEVATNQGFASLVPIQIEGAFLFYMAQHMKPVFCRLAAGTTYAEISRREVRKVRCYLPCDRAEQKRISDILGQADHALNGLRDELAAARRLKTALMQQLFTKGIPGRHRKTQTIEVFRRCVEIPKDWEPARLGPNTTMIQYGTNAASNDYRAGYPVIAIPQVVASRLELGDVPYADLEDDEANELRLMENDVLLIRTNGNPDYMGKSTLVTSEVARSHVVFASYLIRVRTDEDLIRGAYLNYFLASPLGRCQALAMANTSAGNHNLGARSLKQFQIPRPDPKEQDEIVSILHQCEDSIDALKAKIETLLRLKKSLLQNLLTGKVRVTPDSRRR